MRNPFSNFEQNVLRGLNATFDSFIMVLNLAVNIVFAPITIPLAVLGSYLENDDE